MRNENEVKKVLYLPGPADDNQAGHANVVSIGW